ncbi:MAG: trypsin-like peptidase domain-containing protein [Oscillospiraceae bacterium]|nr:trypsin-like peptidase domain-containing protein [Oscillospiraceae bacterium]
MPHKTNRFFLLIFIILLSLICAASALLTSVMGVYEIGLIHFTDDGALMLGTRELAVLARPPLSPSYTLPIVPLPEAPPIQKEPGETLTFKEIYQRAAPSVTVVMAQSPYGRGTGSGIIISEDGYILTNHHVVESAQNITVILHSGIEYTARIIGSDRLSDIAVLRIRASGLVPAEFGDSDAMTPGDPAAAIGNPLGIDLRATITTGVISGINRDITLEDSAGDITMTVLQTNCAVNPGNSGGPLLNQYGQVIGIISSKIMGSTWQSVEGLGFAIPSNTAAPLVEQLIQHGFIPGRPVIGITVDTSYTAAVADSWGLPHGVRVTGVNELSDAHRKGLQANDIITHINGIAVASVLDVNDIRNEHSAGDALRLTVYRRGETLTMEILLMEEGALRS